MQSPLPIVFVYIASVAAMFGPAAAGKKKSMKSPSRQFLVVMLCIAAVLTTETRAADDWSRWSGRQEVILDTTTRGANVPGDVANIPIPLRLDPAALPGVSATGADIRFARMDGTPVPYQIERWEKGKTAIVWVLLDSVKGNTRAAALKMYWGNPAAKDASDGAKVFSTANGYLGAWHLNEAGNTKPNGYRDSSSNQAHGTGVNLTENAGIEGVLGGGQNFSAAAPGAPGAMILIDSAKKNTFDIKGTVSVAAWVKVDKWKNRFETIISKGDRQWRLARIFWDDSLEFMNNRFGPGKVNRGGGVGPTRHGLEDGNWHYVVGTSGKVNNLYIDGQADANPKVPAEGEFIASDYDVCIGNNLQFPDVGAPAPFFTGALDEVQVFNVALTADWIKLAYESQRPDQKLVTLARGSVTGKTIPEAPAARADPRTPPPKKKQGGEKADKK
jgi:biopolymer transport protein ExbB